MSIPESQRAVAAFLAGLTDEPALETHISLVFRGGNTVWKLKKAVRMPFLDFTSLAARKHFLDRELAINQPAAPDLYRDVVAIGRGADGALGFGTGEAVDYVLRMARIGDGDFLDQIAQRSALSPALLDALGDTVAAYHARLPPVTGRDPVAAFARITEGNVRSAVAAGLPANAVAAWDAAMRQGIEACRSWLDERARAGFVRRCHGDLHLGNLCLWHGKPVPFDALEFDEDLATIDVSYDLAFLLMDLERRAGRAAANRVLNRYVARTGDVGLTVGLPIFLSQRALIRAHVLAAIGQDATGYMTAAQAYLTPADMVMVVAIGGLQGTGKSTLARALAPDLGAAPGALVLRSDEIRKRLHGVAPEARLGPEAYGEAANAATNDALVAMARTAALGGKTVILDATFLDPAMRHSVEAALAEDGVRFRGFWLEAPLPVLEARVAARREDVSDATVMVLRQAAARDPGPGSWTSVDATDGAAALAQVRGALISG